MRRPRPAGGAVSSPRNQAPRCRLEEFGGDPFEGVLQDRASSRRRRAGTATWATSGPVSMPASMRIRVTPVSRSPARMAAGMGVAPRCLGSSDGCRFRAPCVDVQQGGRHDPPVVGQHDQLGRRASTAAMAVGVAQPGRGQDRRARRASSATAWMGVAVRRPPRPAGRAGAVTTPTSSTSSGSAASRRSALAAEAAAAQEDRPDRGGGHARALVASRTSASSSPCPTGMSSSIESR